MASTTALVGAVPPPVGITPNFAHPQDVLRTINNVSGILTIALVAPFVLLRLYTRIFISRSFLIEDWFCLLAWLLGTGYCLTAVFMGMHGGGNHEYEITSSNLRGFEQALYANSIVYGPAAFFTKATLLLIFARVFSPFKKTVKGIYVFLAGLLCFYLPVMMIKIRICTPIVGLWRPEVQTTCINQAALFMSDTLMSAVSDLAVLVLPIPLVWSLHMPARKKIHIGILLGAGGVATGASVVRLILVFQPGGFEDKTVTFVRFNLLGVAEIGIGLICASFPAFNILFSKINPNSTNRKNKSKQTPPNSNEIRMERLYNPKPTKASKANPVDTLLQSRSSYVQMGSSKDIYVTHEQQDLQWSNPELVHACTCHVVSSDARDHRPVPQTVYNERAWTRANEMEKGKNRAEASVHDVQSF